MRCDALFAGFGVPSQWLLLLPHALLLHQVIHIRQTSHITKTPAISSFIWISISVALLIACYLKAISIRPS
jgi:hypothetical protein